MRDFTELKTCELVKSRYFQAMKTFIGPKLRKLRREAGETQAQMAKSLGISTSYVNMLEKNERSVSVPVLLRMMEAYGVDWREIADEDGSAQLADLRAALQDPLFDGARPDVAELRALLSHSPDMAACFQKLHQAYMATTDQLLGLANASESDLGILQSSPETTVHNFFREHRNYFPELEAAAEAFWEAVPYGSDDLYSTLKQRLLDDLGLHTRIISVAEMPHSLREHDEERREILLSEGLDYPNRVFQLVHVFGLLTHRELLDTVLSTSGLQDAQGRARCRVELANYYAAAVLMPYDLFLRATLDSKYDFDHLATRFGVSFEQACHRATTLQRQGAKGVPFFFLRIDKAGNVTKRFNSTDFHLAEYGGACPRLDVHTSFRTPGLIAPQFVEMPDGSQFFVFSRTVDRPKFTRHDTDKRLAVAMGCSIEFLGSIGYGEDFSPTPARMTEVGINCRICPRNNCDQRAHHAVLSGSPVDERKRGPTRYGS